MNDDNLSLQMKERKCIKVKQDYANIVQVSGALKMARALTVSINKSTATCIL